MAEELCGGENIRGDDLVKQPGELAIGEADAVESLELFAEVGFKTSAVADVRTILVFESLEFADESVFDMVLPDGTRMINIAFGRGHCVIWMDYGLVRHFPTQCYGARKQF